MLKQTFHQTEAKSAVKSL